MSPCSRTWRRSSWRRRLRPATTSSRRTRWSTATAGEKAGAAGLLCASMPEEYGGSGGSYAHETAIIEALGHVGVDGFGIALHNAIVAPYILHYGSEEQKQKMAAETGDRRADRRHRHDRTRRRIRPAGHQDHGEKDGNQYRINGSKTFITNGQHANLDHRRHQDRPGAGRQGHVADRRRDRRGGRLRARPQPRQDRPEGQRHVRAVLQRRARADLQPARPRGRPGLRPAHAAIAAGAPA